MGEFMGEHITVDSSYAKVRSLQYFQTWQISVSFLLSFSNTYWKENVMKRFFLLLFANAVISGYDQGERWWVLFPYQRQGRYLNCHLKWTSNECVLSIIDAS